MPIVPTMLSKSLTARLLLCLFLAPVTLRAQSAATTTPGTRADAAQLLSRLYAADQPGRLWIDHTASRAQQALALLRTAADHGLDPADYDVEALAGQVERINPPDADSIDRALSGAVLQFLTDLHFGRVTPDFPLPDAQARLRQFDALALVRTALAQQQVPELADAAAPTLPLYRRVMGTLRQYRQLAEQAPEWSAPTGLPKGGKLTAGASYEGLGKLRHRLALLGDLANDDVPANPDQHTEPLAQAIRHFQARHGLPETGQVGPATLATLAVPIPHRVRQLELTLERLRWIPPLRPGRVIVVNVAAYRLWAFDTSDAGSEALHMRVIVGKAARTPTPLFIGQMRYLEFNPYWNVPRSIAADEIAPKLTRNPAYLTQNGMELVSATGQIAAAAPADAAAALRAGTLRVRQRPGAHNVLGAVKFAMPNPMNIYLHSTSAKELFGKARRDLSHGCIRVEQPEALARFVLANQPQWTPQAIEAAMVPGAVVRTVRLSESIPVVLFYATAATDRGGRALFADDIYQRDAPLLRALQAR